MGVAAENGSGRDVEGAEVLKSLSGQAGGPTEMPIRSIEARGPVAVREWLEPAHLAHCGRLPGMVSFLSRKPALSLDARNRSSCPKADLYVVATIVWKRPFEAALGWSVRGVGQIAKLIFQ